MQRCERVARPGTFSGCSAATRSAAANEIRSRSAWFATSSSARSDGVLRVGQHPQVRQRVAHLLALVEPNAAHHAVGQPDAQEHVLEDTRLRVGAVEDGHVRVPDLPGVDQPVDLVGDERGLVVLVVGDVADHLVPVALVRPQPLVAAVRVAGDDGVGGREDALGGAVVLLQQDRARVREVLLELDDVADARAAEGVDRLVGVADHAQLGRFRPRHRRCHQLPDELVLGVVGVLVLVDEHVPEPAPVVLRDGGQPIQQRDRLHDQVVEVERVGRAQALLVDGVDVGDLALVLVGGAGRGVVRGDQLVLEVRDLRREPARRELLRVELEVAGDEPDQPARVVGVVHRERRADAEVLGLAPQDANAHRVERGDPHRVGPPPDESVDPILHLGRGLVGEGDRHDLAGVRPALGEQPGDAVGEHTSLARPGAGDDQQRRPGVDHRLALPRVEPLQQRRAALGAGLDGVLRRQFEQRAHVVRKGTAAARRRRDVGDCWRATAQPSIFLRVPDAGSRGPLSNPHHAPESFGPGAFARHGPGAPTRAGGDRDRDDR
jgi:hypothetical protein